MIKETIRVEKGFLTQEEITLIQHSWATVSYSADMVIDFYNLLFEVYPRLRPLFKEDTRLQARKFTAHISYLISHINDWDRLQSDLAELGKRHVHYEVKAEYFDYVREALFPTMKRHMGGEWNEATEAAWMKFYQMVADRMTGVAHHPDQR